MDARRLDERPILVSAEIYRGSRYASGHPLSIPRVSLTLDLIRLLGWFDPDRHHEASPADDEALARFHDRDYLAALRRVEATQRPTETDRARHRLGTDGNPVYPEMFRRPATSCGGSLWAAERLLAGPGLVYNMGGGTHHGRPDRAAGFCFLNDPVLAILRLLDGGMRRVMYVDLDAHHGDGVEDALSHDPRVLLVSIHEAGRWPGTGRAGDLGRGRARNLPVPSGVTDAELDHLVDACVVPLAAAFQPQALVLQCGCDGLDDDPMSRLALSNRGFAAVVARLAACADRVLALGGGGYNPYALARCWALMWGGLNGWAPPPRLPDAAEALMRSVAWRHRLGRHPPERWLTTLADPPQAPAPVRDEVAAIAASVLKLGP